MNQNLTNVLCIRVFGSQVRADADRMSDTDVLVIVDDHSGKIPENDITALLPTQFQNNINLSWYGRERITTMFREGHLFAWHLLYESISIYDISDFFNELGTPAPYPNALKDIESFLSVLEGIAPAIEATPSNVVYELGLLYVCARNIAMAASWHLSEKPDFTRYSPFTLASTEEINFSMKEYETCMAARMASQRGENPQPMSSASAINLCARMLKWGYNIHHAIQENRLCA